MYAHHCAVLQGTQNAAVWIHTFSTWSNYDDPKQASPQLDPRDSKHARNKL